MTKQSQVQLIPIDNIRVSAVNTRELDETTLEELTASIKARGLKQPILLRPTGPLVWTVVFGRHRFEACKRAGLKEIPAFVEEMDDDEEMVLKVTENAHRNAFVNPVIEGEIFAKLLKKYKTINDLAEAIGKKTQYVNDRIGVYYRLEVSLRKYVGKELTVRNAIALSREPNAWKQKELADKIIAFKNSETSNGWVGGGGMGKPKQIELFHRCPIPECHSVHRIGKSIEIEQEE